MQTTPERPRRWWKRWWFWAGAIPVGLALLTVFAAERTSRSSFCTTCHYMEPFYESWRTSTHKDVECIVCHYPPGIQSTIHGKLRGLYQVASYLSQAYKRSRPWAEIEDASCLRPGCHEVNIMADTTVVMFLGVKFQHAAHLERPRRGKQLRCTSCHSQIVQGEHMVVTPSTCMLCHMRAGGTLSEEERAQGKNECLLCHLRPGGEHASTHPRLEGLSVTCSQCHGMMVAGDGAVEHERCFACHWEQARLQEFGNTELLHRVHISEHKIECLNCHSLIQHKTIQAQSVVHLDCQGCHPNLHEPQHALFTGTGARHVPVMPNPMFARGIQCQSCHVYHQHVQFPELGENVKASGEVCEQCHGRGFMGLLARWDQATTRNLRSLRAMEREVRQRAQKRPSAPVFSLLDSVDYNLSIVTKGRPVHNIRYAGAILDSSYALLVSAADSVRPKVRLPAFHAGADSKLPTECSSCHIALTRGTVKTFGNISFSHEIHVDEQNLPCTMCHSNTRRHGELVIQPSGCADCHHRPNNAASCNPCHEPQYKLFTGRSVLFGDRPAPNSNLHIEQPCRACHGGQGRVVKATPQACGSCHEASYGEMIAEWQTETRQSVADVEAALNAVAVAQLTAEQREQYRLVREAVTALADDRSWGVHNADRATTILERAGELLGAMPKLPTP